MTQQTWTEKHDAYCLQSKLTPTAKLIWQWLIHTERPEEAEPDLKQFNTWATKHRGRPFHRDTLKIAWNQLVETGIIRPLKQFTWAIWRVVIRPINLLLHPISTPRKRSRKTINDRGLQPSNNSNTTQGVQAAAADILSLLPEQLTGNLEQNLELCAKAGINFEPKDAGKILGTCDPEDVKQAIALFNKRGGHRKIKNPEGFIRWALDKVPWFNFKPSITEALLGLAEYLGVTGDG